jgi:hypothetical protein
MRLAKRILRISLSLNARSASSDADPVLPPLCTGCCERSKDRSDSLPQDNEDRASTLAMLIPARLSVTVAILVVLRRISASIATALAVETRFEALALQVFVKGIITARRFVLPMKRSSRARRLRRFVMNRPAGPI